MLYSFLIGTNALVISMSTNEYSFLIGTYEIFISYRY